MTQGVPDPIVDNPTVQLLHEQARGSHIDWLIGRDPEGRRPLVTFRAAGRIDELAAGERTALEPVADHRPVYLEYEGPISGDRGRVRRVAAGRVRRWEAGGGAWRLRVRWSGAGGAVREQDLEVDAGRSSVVCLARRDGDG
ncbi:MAG: hypothetical protein ACYTG1_10300 [Planctomycetota bacterium]